jgi:hypothetical protein
MSKRFGRSQRRKLRQIEKMIIDVEMNFISMTDDKNSFQSKVSFCIGNPSKCENRIPVIMGSSDNGNMLLMAEVRK